MKTLIFIFSCFLACYNSFAQNNPNAVKVSDNLEVYHLTLDSYVHVSYSETQWGRIGSNGLILVQGKQAFLFDTPMEESTTRELVKYIQDSLHAKVNRFIPNHWHEDCVGGLSYLHSIGVKSYSNELTADLCKKAGKAVPQTLFKDSLTLKFGKFIVNCFYPGPAHSVDNIVVWIPSKEILFAGCMAKEMKSQNMGNYADGDLKTWPATIKKVMDRYPSAKIVIPGHGAIGGFELLVHTYELAQANASL